MLPHSSLRHTAHVQCILEGCNPCSASKCARIILLQKQIHHHHCLYTNLEHAAASPPRLQSRYRWWCDIRQPCRAVIAKIEGDTVLGVQNEGSFKRLVKECLSSSPSHLDVELHSVPRSNTAATPRGSNRLAPILYS